ncbi:DUF5107 domain-containing protein [Galbibacter sp. EGI 63066]|uniref:DUF5107 domain-containing protein n=1 Tax=Galbibacter sp. EGI 63066 TaxID=2993559 RepID=UPI002249049D|nr:DUF5107 domain-containing protein [Galbibacter sp. EGI 63066]MCX2679792.1 DUF5107 domain-containing protein [Galbibacter sp. EGI 63066]
MRTANKVKAWKAKINIPTYETGSPEKYPFFLEKRVYQGSSGVVYPNPVIEQISDHPVAKEWNVIYLENQYLKIMVLPELGGRIQMAFDKIKQRHFVYYNHVIKPALVGLTGPWISGGIEFNWPQHHRPSTYEPVDSCIEENTDGSVTVWVSETERMSRTKGMAGFTLYPDKAYLEIKGRVYNRTPHPQTFLWWANPAVAVNDHYQSVFPPDVHAVFDHGKRDVSEFPIASGEYYKVDYSPGTDISRYKNIPVPTSYMAITSKYDFVGGYENDTEAGLLHIADHHISPGKKQWTWGNGDFGHAWDRNLTETDGPYIELMCGVYTDNQPDFSWLHPYEEKSFRQYFMPYHSVGVVKNATKNALVNMEKEGDKVVLKIYVTAVYPDSDIVLSAKKETLYRERTDLRPEKGYQVMINLRGYKFQELEFCLRDDHGNILLTWVPEPEEKIAIPKAAKAAKAPGDIVSTEQLYLTGLHLEQYRHATYNPEDYYKEALSREPGDVRNNNAMGLWYLRRGRFRKALKFFETAIATLTDRNPNPYDGEAFFNKGMCLKFLGNLDKSYEAFFKSCWNAAWQDAGYFNLAQICCRNREEKALELVQKSLIRNWHNHKARHLKAIILRKLGQSKAIEQLISESLKIDRFNFGMLFEKYLLSLAEQDLEYFKSMMRDYVHNYIELAIDYAEAGEYLSAIKVLELYSDGKKEFYPMAAYFMAYFYAKTGQREKSDAYYKIAVEMPVDYCFPNRLEEVVVLKTAIKDNPEDSHSHYYLGNFWYASRQYDHAREAWEKAIRLDPDNAICHRNLALLYYNKTDEKDLAQTHLEEAFSIGKKNARILMELDQLYKKRNISVKTRLQLFEQHRELCNSRDDTYLELATLHNLLDDSERALHLIESRKFHPWEGGEGKVPFQYVTAKIEIAKKLIIRGDYQEAIAHLETAKIYPENLGEGKLFGTQENDIDYWLGIACEKLGDTSGAAEYFRTASVGLSDPSPATFYNDQQPDKIFYQGLALLKLGSEREARERFEKLIAYGKDHGNDTVKIDYFAVSLPDLLIFEEDLDQKNRAHSHYLEGLGNMGLKQWDTAKRHMEHVLKMNNSHTGARIHLNLLAKRSFLEGVLLLKNRTDFGI